MKVGVNGVVRDISDLKVGVSGAVRAVSEAYIGVSGAIKKVWPNKKELNDCTWDEISEISSSGQAANYFAVGDCKEITLGWQLGGIMFDNFVCCVFIIGINHNASLEGNNLIHFQLAKSALENGKDICFVNNYASTTAGFRMNRTQTNEGGWEKSYCRSYYCGTRKTPMPTGVVNLLMQSVPELYNVLKAVTKYTDNVGNGTGSVASNITATTEYVFLLSPYEVFNETGQANKYEANYQKQYAYYGLGNSEIKYMYDNVSQGAAWWLRSPMAGFASYFTYVDSNGFLNFNAATMSYGFAPCFCV